MDTFTTIAQLTTANAAAATMPLGMRYGSRCDWIAKRDALVHQAALLELENASGVDYFDRMDRAADGETVEIEVYPGGTIYNIESNESYQISRTRFATARRVHGVMTIFLGGKASRTVADTEYRIIPADAPAPIYINNAAEAAFAVACITRRKRASRAA